MFNFELIFFIQDAVIRRFEIIGEAAKVPATFRDQQPNVEWVLMTYMRNKLILSITEFPRA